MQVFVLNMDRSVTVEYVPGTQADYTAACCPKGQIFVIKLNSWFNGWHCLHRATNTWELASKVPDEVKLAEMIVN